MPRCVCITFLVVALTGCAEVQALQAQVAARHATADDATCKSYGLTFGTTAYAECRENAATQRNAADIAMQQHMDQESVETKCTTDGNSTNCKTQ